MSQQQVFIFVFRFWPLLRAPLGTSELTVSLSCSTFTLHPLPGYHLPCHPPGSFTALPSNLLVGGIYYITPPFS